MENGLDKYISNLTAITLCLIPVIYLLNVVNLFPTYLFDTITVLDLLFIIAAACSAALIAISLIRGRFRWNKGVFITSLLFLLSIIISTITSQSVYTSLYGNTFSMEGLLHYICYFTMMFAVALIRDNRAKNRVFYAFVFVGILEAVLAIMQTCFHVSFSTSSTQYLVESNYRAFGTFSNQNPFGTFMGMVAAMMLGYVALKSKTKVCYIQIGLLFLFLFALILSGTRAAILSVGIVAVWALVLGAVYRKKQKMSCKDIVAYVICTVLLVTIAALTSSSVSDIFSRVVSEVTNLNWETIGSGRLQIWYQAWEQFKEHPIFGVGVANFIYQTGEFTAADGGLNYSMSFSYVVHNQYLEVLTTQGIIGFVTYLAMIVSLLMKAKQSWRWEMESDHPESLGMVFGLVCFLISDLFSWHIIYLTPYFYVLCGLVFSQTEETVNEALQTKGEGLSSESVPSVECN